SGLKLQRTTRGTIRFAPKVGVATSRKRGRRRILSNCGTNPHANASHACGLLVMYGCRSLGLAGGPDDSPATSDLGHGRSNRIVLNPDDKQSSCCLMSLLAERALATPSAPAILAPGRPPLSYAQLHQQVQAVAASLAGLGLGNQDAVALVLPNGPELACAFL